MGTRSSGVSTHCPEGKPKLCCSAIGAFVAQGKASCKINLAFCFTPDTVPYMRLGYAINALRVNRGLSLRQMAKRIGVPHSTLYRFEHGRSIEFTAFAKITLWLFGEEKQ